MHIIVVSDHQSAPRSFTLGRAHLLAFVVFMLTGLLGLVLGIQSLVGDNPARLAMRAGMPAVSDVGPTLNMMAGKLGEMEAQLLRLDAFSARMSQMLGPRGGAQAREAVPVSPAVPPVNSG